jgi:hypothetical protein
MLVAEDMLKRAIQRGEVIHHRDGDKTNDFETNLCVMPSRTHSQLHKILGSIGIPLINAGHLKLVISALSVAEHRDLVSLVYADRVKEVSSANFQIR